MHSFASDYHCKPHPAVVKAVVQAMEEEPSGTYGADDVTLRAEELLQEYFGEHTSILFVANGTAANRLALQTILNRPYHSVIATSDSHINTHEGGALESLGHKILPISTNNGKVDPKKLFAYLHKEDDVHLTLPHVLSISNATEVGTVYLPKELEHIRESTRSKELLLHIDGARLANAFVSCGVSHLTDERLKMEADADAITVGGTKNGGIMGDAVILSHHHSYHSLADVALRIRKQQGQLCPRMHVIAAQFIALFTDDLWLKNARQSNTMASLLADRCMYEIGLKPVYPVQSNAVFVKLPKETISNLLQKTEFYVWDRTEGIVRWMCSWDTTEKDVDEFINLVKKHL